MVTKKKNISSEIGSLTDVFNEQVGVQKSVESEERGKEVYERFAFICSPELVGKVKTIARKEGFTIRSLMEYMMKEGIAGYEQKHGIVEVVGKKDVNDVM